MGNFKNLKKVIDADTYSTGGMLQRAQRTTISKEEEDSLGDMITVRSKKQSRNYGRK